MLAKEVQLITLNYNLVQVIMLLKWTRIFMLTDSFGDSSDEGENGNAEYNR